LGTHAFVKRNGTLIGGSNTLDDEFPATLFAGLQSQLFDYGCSMAPGTLSGFDRDLFEDERTAGFKPAIGPADATIVDPWFDDVVLALSTFFEVPVSFQIEGCFFQGSTRMLPCSSNWVGITGSRRRSLWPKVHANQVVSGANGRDRCSGTHMRPGVQTA